MRGDSRIARLIGGAAVVVVTASLSPGPVFAQGEGTASSPASLEERLERRIEELEKANARYEAAIREQERLEQRVEELEREKLAREGSGGGVEKPLEQRLQELESERLAREELRLEQRVEELETTQVAQEDATRSIIRQSVSGLGSNINEFVVFGGTLEVLSGWEQDFQKNSESTLRLNTAELDFEVQVGDWARGSLILQYEDGADSVFTTTTDDEATVDRLSIDTAFVTLGNVEQFWPYAVVGRMIVPFGISTGDPVLDALTINDPLTLEIFESREDAILIGAAFPTRPLAPPVEIPSPPPVRPVLLQPLVSKLAQSLGYKPLPTPPPKPEFTTLAADPPPFNVGVYTYQGDTFDRVSRENEWSADGHWGATVGYRTKGYCRPLLGQPPGAASEDLGWLHAFCPWKVDVDVDYNNSVFDSNLLGFEYQRWLNQIGFVPGMAASLKANLGPVGFVAEWNGALKDATFNDDIRRPISIKPSAWQVALVYQFDWNPGVETLGTQGTYATVGYSESRDMRGVARLSGGLAERVGFVPEKRFLVSIGEWVTDGVRIAVEYAYVQDYSTHNGGTGRHANGVFTMLTYEW
jgi:hypothetical protein